MKIFSYFLISYFLFSYFLQINSFLIDKKIILKKLKNNNKIYSVNLFRFNKQNNLFYNYDFSTNLNKIKNEFTSFYKLIRGNSILPTLIISIAGGWIVNPSLSHLLKSKSFFIGCIITLLIMSSSMIINDIFDLDIDKINNPSRPLVTKEISIERAYLYLFLMIGSARYLSINYLPYYLQRITLYSIFMIFIYTPFLKKILFIKNLFCATLVSFSIYFSAYCSIYSNQLINTLNLNILSLGSRLLFIGSLCNEILLDISDYEGDKLNKIKTIPVVFGKKIAFILVKFLILINIFYNYFILINLKNFYYGIILLSLLSPLYFNLKNINYELKKKDVKKFLNQTNIPLFLSLLFLCFLSYQN